MNASERPRCTARRTGAGFSLVELLVVAAVISLLASMLVPAIAMIRDAAMKTQCKSNLHQVGLAYGSYMNDFEGFLADANGGYNNCYVTSALMDPYLLRSDSAWRCKMMLRYMQKPTAWYGDGVYYHNWHIPNRDMPPFGKNDATPVASRMPVSLARIVCPPEAMVFADMDGGSSGGYHRKRANMLMADLSLVECVDESRSDATAKNFSLTPRSVTGGWIRNTTGWAVRGFSFRP